MNKEEIITKLALCNARNGSDHVEIPGLLNQLTELLGIPKRPNQPPAPVTPPNAGAVAGSQPDIPTPTGHPLFDAGVE